MTLGEIRKIFKKYMVPFIEEHGYRLSKTESSVFVFENEENLDLKIVYGFQRYFNGPFELNVIIKRNNEGVWPYISLTCFLADPSFPDPTFLYGNWYFDTEDELIGAIEEQAELFTDKAFDWLKSKEEVDVSKIADERAEQRAKVSHFGTSEEKERLLQEIRFKSEEWRKRRLKPKTWL